MQDPTRITGILNALRRTWEGQPDLSLSQLIGVLQNRGLGWASTDEEAVALLHDLEREHPSLIDGTSGPHTVTTVNPPQLVTLSGDLVVVRSGEDPERMPAVWRWSSMRKAGPGLPLVIADTGGVEHRLGVVTLVTRLGEPEASISIAQKDVGSRRWLVQFEDGARALVGQRIRLWRVNGREVLTERMSWKQILRCEPGEDMQIAPAGGGEPVSLGPVARVLLLDG